MVQHYDHSTMIRSMAVALNVLKIRGFLNRNEKNVERGLRFMGPKEEDGVLVGGRFDRSFWKLINLRDRERHY